MTEVKLDIAPEAIKAALQDAILGVLTPQKREELIKESLQKLLAGGWTSPSELQRIFQQAATDVAREAAKAELEKPENKERITALVQEAWERVFVASAREKLLARVANHISDAICGKEY